MLCISGTKLLLIHIRPHDRVVTLNCLRIVRNALRTITYTCSQHHASFSRLSEVGRQAGSITSQFCELYYAVKISTGITVTVTMLCILTFCKYCYRDSHLRTTRMVSFGSNYNQTLKLELDLHLLFNAPILW